jgi:flagellar motility protein MotE (MotC chaperone)
MRWPRVRALPAFCAVAGLALVVKLTGVVLAAGDLALPAAQAAEAAAAAPAASPQPQSAPAEADKAARPAPPPVDADTLQALAQRRGELDRRAEEMREQEATLAAAQKRIEEKLALMREIEAKITAAAKQQEAEEDGRIRSLVKIYETMKPKDAARVFEQLELPVLLKVLERMKEAKSAPILAAMDPGKAKTVTVAIAAKDDPSLKEEPKGRNGKAPKP